MCECLRVMCEAKNIIIIMTIVKKKKEEEDGKKKTLRDGRMWTFPMSRVNSGCSFQAAGESPG